MSGVLLAHKGAVVVTRRGLEGIEAPQGTETWKPVKHATLVSAFYVGHGLRVDLERLESDAMTALIESLKRHGVKNEVAHR